jgi:flagellar FliL protein
MSDIVAQPTTERRRIGRRPLLAGLALAPFAAAGGYLAVRSGVLPTGSAETETGSAAEPLGVVFLPVTPMVISIGRGGLTRHLRFEAQLEVDPLKAQDVALLMPRVVDVLNGFLRAVDVTDLEDPAALLRLRAQMLRRVQIVTGEGAVRDLLVMEFVVN